MPVIEYDDDVDPEDDYSATREAVHACAVWLVTAVLLLFIVVTVVHWLTTHP